MNPIAAPTTKAYLNVESAYHATPDDLKITGLYTLAMDGKYGVLAVFATSAFICQYFGYHNGVMYRRYSINDAFWGSWVTL